MEATVVAVEATGVVLDQTVFYARGGGQPGDSGVLVTGDGTELKVVDTIKGAGDQILHQLEQPGAAAVQPGQRLTGRIDWDRRHRHMRMHTCLHLLCALVDAPVTGGNLNELKGRLDFDLPKADQDKARLSAELNELIRADTATSLEWISEADLQARPELVRTLSVQPPRGSGTVRLLRIPGVDVQPCGGTHVARTGEIGRVRVSKIEKKSRQNRRINVLFDD
jgi:misacylated tRNA(Ala) deacylase